MAGMTDAAGIVLVVTTGTAIAFLIEYSMLRLILTAMVRGLPRNDELRTPGDGAKPSPSQPRPQSGLGSV